MKAAVIDGVPDLTGLVAVPVYDTKPVHFILMCCNGIKRIQKTRQVYETKTDMAQDALFLYLDVNALYNHNMKWFGLSDQLRNVYWVDQWMRK